MISFLLQNICAEADLPLKQMLLSLFFNFRAEQTASELESRLDSLDNQLEELIRMHNIPPELLDVDNETLRRILETSSSSMLAREETVEVRVREEGEGQGQEPNGNVGSESADGSSRTEKS